MAIDWFEPPAEVDDDAALDRWREHLARARAFAADEPMTTDARVEAARDFAAWCDRVRGDTGYDWRFAVLKRLSHDHASAHGWGVEDYARGRTFPPRPGDLAFILPSKDRDVAIWTGAPVRLDGAGEPLTFYLSYAHGDLLDAAKWQLARGDNDTATNPFVPLLELYARGYYPFRLDAASAVLFRFR